MRRNDVSMVIERIPAGAGQSFLFAAAHSLIRFFRSRRTAEEKDIG